jgi:hypothetical protein
MALITILCSSCFNLGAPEKIDFENCKDAGDPAVIGFLNSYSLRYYSRFDTVEDREKTQRDFRDFLRQKNKVTIEINVTPFSEAKKYSGKPIHEYSDVLKTSKNVRWELNYFYRVMLVDLLKLCGHTNAKNINIRLVGEGRGLSMEYSRRETGGFQTKRKYYSGAELLGKLIVTSNQGKKLVERKLYKKMPPPEELKVRGRGLDGPTVPSEADFMPTWYNGWLPTIIKTWPRITDATGLEKVKDGPGGEFRKCVERTLPMLKFHNKRR